MNYTRFCGSYRQQNNLIAMPGVSLPAGTIFTAISMQNSVFILRNSSSNSALHQLREWAKNRTDVGGVIQISEDEKLYFEDVLTAEKRIAEARPKEKRPFVLGDKKLSATTYEWAADTILDAPENPKVKWLLISEIGELELQREGYNFALRSLLFSPLPGVNLVLVLNSEVADKVIKQFDIKSRVKEFEFPE